MIRIRLPEAEAEELEARFRSTTDRKLRDRLQIVLMAHRGRPRREIAEDLGIHRIGVTRRLNAYCDRGLDGLLPRKAPGGTPRIPAARAPEQAGGADDRQRALASRAADRRGFAGEPAPGILACSTAC